MPDSHLQVGAPDPERETSPIGEYVLSGSELLRCESPGLWVREGELRTDRLPRS